MGTRVFLMRPSLWFWLCLSLPFSKSCDYIVCARALSHVQFFASLQSVIHQAPLFMGFPRQEYWSGLPFPSSRDLPNPGIESVSLVSPGRCMWQIHGHLASPTGINQIILYNLAIKKKITSAKSPLSWKVLDDKFWGLGHEGLSDVIMLPTTSLSQSIKH